MLRMPLVCWLLLAALWAFPCCWEAHGSPSRAATPAVGQPPVLSEDKEKEPTEDDDEPSQEEEADEAESKEAAKDEAESEDETDAKKPQSNQADDETSSKGEADESKEDDKDKSRKDEKASADAGDSRKGEAQSDSKEKEKAKAEDASKEKKPATFTVEAKDLEIEVEADGVFVAEESEEVAIRPEVWSTFKVLEAVPHGKRVRKGEVLVKFDDKDIEKAIAEKSLELRAGELALMAAEEEFPRIEKSIALNYEEAKRQYEEAKDEKQRFDETMRDMSEKMAKYYLESSEQQFQNASEEYQQLKKMYDADELTEETEEIVLKRQKFQVEAAKFFLEYAKINHQYTTEISIPQREESLKTAVEMAKIQFDRASMAKSLGMNQQRYELEKMREARTKAVDSHAKLMADRRLMTLKSPADGVVYFGRQVNGRWIEISSLESKLVPYGTVTPNSVVVTVVKDRPLYVETSVGEKDLPSVKKEQASLVTPVADSDVELKAVVESVASVPGAGNKFPVRLNLKTNDVPDWLMPGMTCKTKITVYDAKDAIVIPADLLQSDEDEPKQKYVMLKLDDEEKPVRRDVKVGKKKEKEVEIVKGLEAGDVIVKGAKDDAKEDADDKGK